MSVLLSVKEKEYCGGHPFFYVYNIQSSASSTQAGTASPSAVVSNGVGVVVIGKLASH